MLDDLESGQEILLRDGLIRVAVDTVASDHLVAVALAGDKARLSRFREELRGLLGGAPLLDGARFARDLERVYREIWSRWCETRRNP